MIPFFDDNEVPEIDYDKLSKEILCAEVCADMLIAYHYFPDTRESIDSFFETLPEMRVGAVKASEIETAELLMPSFLRPGIVQLVEKWTEVEA